MQSNVSALLLLTSSVILGCIVVGYAVSVVECTLQSSNVPQLAELRSLQSSLLNQTDALLNQASAISENNVYQVPPQNVSSSVFESLP